MANLTIAFRNFANAPKIVNFTCNMYQTFKLM